MVPDRHQKIAQRATPDHRNQGYNSRQLIHRFCTNSRFSNLSIAAKKYSGAYGHPALEELPPSAERLCSPRFAAAGGRHHFRSDQMVYTLIFPLHGQGRHLGGLGPAELSPSVIRMITLAAIAVA